MQLINPSIGPALLALVALSVVSGRVSGAPSGTAAFYQFYNSAALGEDSGPYASHIYLKPGKL